MAEFALPKNSVIKGKGVMAAFVRIDTNRYHDNLLRRH